MVLFSSGDPPLQSVHVTFPTTTSQLVAFRFFYGAIYHQSSPSASASKSTLPAGRSCFDTDNEKSRTRHTSITDRSVGLIAPRSTSTIHLRDFPTRSASSACVMLASSRALFISIAKSVADEIRMRRDGFHPLRLIEGVTISATRNAFSLGKAATQRRKRHTFGNSNDSKDDDEPCHRRITPPSARAAQVPFGYRTRPADSRRISPQLHLLLSNNR